MFIRTGLLCFDFKYSDFVCFVEFLVSNISRKMAWSEREACFWSQKRATTLQCNWQGLSLLYLLPHLWRSILVALRELKEITPDSVLQLYIAMSHTVLFCLSTMKPVLWIFFVVLDCLCQYVWIQRSAGESVSRNFNQ